MIKYTKSLSLRMVNEMAVSNMPLERSLYDALELSSEASKEMIEIAYLLRKKEPL